MLVQVELALKNDALTIYKQNFTGHNWNVLKIIFRLHREL